MNSIFPYCQRDHEKHNLCSLLAYIIKTCIKCKKESQFHHNCLTLAENSICTKCLKCQCPFNEFHSKTYENYQNFKALLRYEYHNAKAYDYKKISKDWELILTLIKEQNPSQEVKENIEVALNFLNMDDKPQNFIDVFFENILEIEIWLDKDQKQYE